MNNIGKHNKGELLMLRVAICDDDIHICSEIEKVIMDYANTSPYNIGIEIFISGEELIRFIQKEHTFDLIFLDIELGSTTGIDVGSKIRNQLDDYISKIVFISSKTGYERRLFDLQPLNFLDKPVEKENLFRCIELALKISEKEKKVFKYQVGHEFKQATINEIMYFENSLRKVSVIMCDEMDEFYGSLKSIKKQLPNTFISPHASYLVNYNYIERISKETIFMKNGTAIPISKRKLKEIHNLQIQFIKEIRDVNL